MENELGKYKKFVPIMRFDFTCNFQDIWMLDHKAKGIHGMLET